MKKRLTGLLLLLSFVAMSQSRLGIQRYGHVVLPVRAISASIPFYTNVLGLKLVAVPSALASSQAWFDVGGGQQIRLVDTDAKSGGGRGNNVHIALVVNSLKQTEQTLRQLGLTPTRQPNATGRPALHLTDPDGYLVELSEEKAERPGFLQSAAKSIWRSVTEVE